MAQVISNVGQNEYLPYKPIQFQQNPTGQDYAEVGHIGLNMVTNTAFIAGNQINGVQTWLAVAAAAGIATTQMTIDPNDLTVVAGDINVTAGDINVAAGNIEATLGGITAGTSLIAGTSISATNGNITAVSGNVVIADPTKGVTLGTGVQILSGTGDPDGVVTAAQGTVFFRTDGTTASEVIYVNTDSTTSWSAMAAV